MNEFIELIVGLCELIQRLNEEIALEIALWNWNLKDWSRRNSINRIG